MQGFDQSESCRFIVSTIEKKPFRDILEQLPSYIQEFIEADLQYMHQADVLDKEGYQSFGEYDDDDAYEAIYLSWLKNHPEKKDDDMVIAQLVAAYLEVQNRFLTENGLAEL